MKYTHFQNEIETEKPKHSRDWLWWLVLAIIISYFAGHLLLAIIR